MALYFCSQCYAGGKNAMSVSVQMLSSFKKAYAPPLTRPLYSTEISFEFRAWSLDGAFCEVLGFRYSILDPLYVISSIHSPHETADFNPIHEFKMVWIF